MGVPLFPRVNLRALRGRPSQTTIFVESQGQTEARIHGTGMTQKTWHRKGVRQRRETFKRELKNYRADSEPTAPSGNRTTRTSGQFEPLNHPNPANQGHLLGETILTQF